MCFTSVFMLSDSLSTDSGSEWKVNRHPSILRCVIMTTPVILNREITVIWGSSIAHMCVW